MIKVYCDNGGYDKRLKNVPGMVIQMFPYENTNRNIPNTGLVSKAGFIDLDNFNWDTMPGFLEYEGSDKYELIEKIIGKENRRDVLHLDSAYKADCDCFFTRDIDDIYKNRVALSNLLNLKIYHPDKDWEDFLSFVDHHISN